MRFRHRLVATLLLLLAFAPALAAQVPPTRTTVKVGAYNLQNLFDAFDDPYTTDEGTRAKADKQAEKLAAVLHQLDADLVAFEEVENEGVLRAFVAERLADLGYAYVAAATSNDVRGIRTAVASRLPIRSITSYRFVDLKLDGEERTWRFARDLMHVELQVTERRVLHAFVVHLKSKRDDPGDKQSAKWRLAEATGARRIIGDLMAKDPGAWIMMLGDFNDTPDSAPIRALLGPPGAAPGPTGAALVDLHAAASPTGITYLRAPYQGRIDYILANEALAKRVVKDSAVIVRPGEGLVGGSDHAPVTATFDVKD